MAFDPLSIPGITDEPQYLSQNSTWIYHIPMVPVFLHLLQPRTFVELGTFRGDSYLAFCQAIVKQSLSTRCTAIDTWEGDEHASRYSSALYDELKQVHDPLYGRFSRLFKSLFDGALKEFPDHSIDLLHIDGLHTYDAVRHDYETWLPKLSDRGVVLFHDTAVRDRNFGVWQLWQEISAGKPCFEISYGCGLGILAVGKDIPSTFLDFLAALNADANRILPFFIALGRRNELARSGGLLAHSLHDCQTMLNSWRQGTGQAIRNKTPNVGRAVADPVAFARLVNNDAGATINDAVNLLTEITELRKFKATHSPQLVGT